MNIDHLINGQRVAGQDYFDNINPATQEVIGQIARGGTDDVNAAVASHYPKEAAAAQMAAGGGAGGAGAELLGEGLLLDVIAEAVDDAVHGEPGGVVARGDGRPGGVEVRRPGQARRPSAGSPSCGGRRS